QLSVSMDEIKRFRQIDSRTPGHPESHLTTGVETTTGPLGQGAGNSVGMAMAGKWLAANFNKPGFTIFDYNVFAICGDGDMMEGVCCEAASLAGHLKLGNLCWIYDNNRVTLDGPAWWSFSEDVMTRFVGYGWNVTRVADANDLAMLARGFETFLKTTGKPTLIVVDSHIGYGSPHKQDSYGKVVNALAKNIPWLIGGSADLAKSNKTNLDFPGAGEFLPGEYKGRNLHYGVREHAMGAAMSGMALSKLRPFGGTFFNFSDYEKPAIRLAALMEVPVIYVFTHDSIGLGEDGPTHQPIEQLAALRAMPNILVLRPGDANEVVEAWKLAITHTHGPTALVLSRQAMPTFDRTKFAPA